MLAPGWPLKEGKAAMNGWMSLLWWTAGSNWQTGAANDLGGPLVRSATIAATACAGSSDRTGFLCNWEKPSGWSWVAGAGRETTGLRVALLTALSESYLHYTLSKYKRSALPRKKKKRYTITQVCTNSKDIINLTEFAAYMLEDIIQLTSTMCDVKMTRKK